MATWQYDLELLPRDAVASLCRGVPDQLEDSTFETVDFWAGIRLPEDYAVVLSSFLEPCESWTMTARIWGEMDGNRIDVGLTDAGVSGITVRVDVRGEFEDFVKHALQFARYCGCVLMNERMHILEPRTRDLFLDIVQSAAFRFARDPEAFLRHVNNGRRDGWGK